jgi:hypothetical protein
MLKENSFAPNISTFLQTILSLESRKIPSSSNRIGPGYGGLTQFMMTDQYEVKVMLQPTISRSVSPGFKPHLCLMTGH